MARINKQEVCVHPIYTDIYQQHKDCDNEVDYYTAYLLNTQNYYPFGMLIPGRTFVNSSYRYGHNGQELHNEITGVNGANYTATFWEYDSRLGRRWNMDPKLNPSMSYYSCFAGNPIWYNDVLGDKPTKKEAAAISAHVYGDKKVDILRGGWKLSDKDFGIEKNTKEGLKSQVNESTIASGKRKGETEYVYAIAGTEDWTDVVEDLAQPLGLSMQYEQSIGNAKSINDQFGKGIELTFTGHSLGGGEVAANAYATGRDAITFNAAGVSPLTQKANSESQIDAYRSIKYYSK